MTTRRKIRVLVTGATGFLGSNLLAALMAEPTVAPVAAFRRREKLPRGFTGEVREGDLLDPAYRRALVEDIDVVCHAAAWASLWNHATLERERFYEPTRDLIEQSIRCGVRRFIQASTVVIAALTGRWTTLRPPVIPDSGRISTGSSSSTPTCAPIAGVAHRW